MDWQYTFTTLRQANLFDFINWQQFVFPVILGILGFIAGYMYNKSKSLKPI